MSVQSGVDVTGLHVVHEIGGRREDLIIPGEASRSTRVEGTHTHSSQQQKRCRGWDNHGNNYR